MSIASKLKTIAENEIKVHKAGQVDILKESKYMNATANGEIVSIGDVSPVEHDVGVKVSSKNLIVDLANYNLGTNCVNNGDGTLRANILVGSYRCRLNTKMYNDLIMNNLGKPFTFSYRTSRDRSDSRAGVVIYGTLSTGASYQEVVGTGVTSESHYVTITPSADFTKVTSVDLRMLNKGGGYTEADTETIISDIQLERGSVATAYTPYTKPGQNLLPSIEEQTVNGITLSKTSDGAYVLNGTAEYSVFEYGTITLGAGTYRLSANNTGAKDRVFLYLYNDVDLIGTRISLYPENAEWIITVPSTTELTYKITVDSYDSPLTLNNFIINPVLVEVGTEVVSVKKYGKNLLDLSTAETVNCTINADGTVQSNIPNGNYCTIRQIGLAELLLENRGEYFTFSVADKNDKAIGFLLYKGTTAVKAFPESLTGSTTIQVPEDIDFDRAIFRFNIGSKREDKTTVFSGFQFELGNTATEYEPYIEPTTYAVSEDGVVNGVKSIAPSMTLTTDTDGVAIECSYLRDIDTYINNLMTDTAMSIEG